MVSSVAERSHVGEIKEAGARWPKLITCLTFSEDVISLEAPALSVSAVPLSGRGVLIDNASMPVATTDTRITPSNFSSKADPKIIVASGSTSSRMRFAASSTSNKVMSIPPVMLMRTALAPFIELSSRSGLLIADSAASMALVSPEASPVPIIALPISDITARISAKSRLISPGLIMRSVTPQTP